MPRLETWTRVAIAGLAAVLLFWGLGDRYLWQDEANTAVLGDRLLRFGRPLSYDRVNLVSLDHYAAEDESTMDQRTSSARAAIDYYAARGDFKRDTTWIFHPWGQFAMAALGIKIGGHTALAVRLPFALAGLAAVLLLFRFSTLAALLLVLNPYWILHARQCRYYPFSSLLLILTVLGYNRWREGRSHGALLFVAAAWTWFEFDYGTFWPVCTVLFLYAFAERPREWLRTVGVGAALAASVAPFAWYYQLWGRRSIQVDDWVNRFRDNFLLMNSYVAPAIVVAAALVFLVMRWKKLPAAERRLATVSACSLIAVAFWVPSVGPTTFLRYSILSAPLGTILAAWLLMRLFGSRWAWPAALVVAFTPWLLYGEGPMLRAEIFGSQPDPNRIVIEYLRRHAAPTDEILINYEDLPLIFYLPNPVRGGIVAFRVEDNAVTKPRYVIFRRSADFVYWPAFERELARYQWTRIPIDAPDIAWGNNPDPIGIDDDRRASPDLYMAIRQDPGAAANPPARLTDRRPMSAFSEPLLSGSPAVSAPIPESAPSPPARRP